MSSTVEYFNANADWQFVIQDLSMDGSAYGFDIGATFRPDADKSTIIADCSTNNGLIRITRSAGCGPSITVDCPAQFRTWQPSRPTLVVADVVGFRNAGFDLDKRFLKRLSFIALPGTTASLTTSPIFIPGFAGVDISTLTQAQVDAIQRARFAARR